MDSIADTTSSDATLSASLSPPSSRAAPSFKRPLLTGASSTTRPPDGRHTNFKGVRPIHPTVPTACVRRASLVYRAPVTLHGGASRLLRHILRASSLTVPQKTEYVPSSPVDFLSLPPKQLDCTHKCLNRSDEILGGFLLNNGGYLDDSDSEPEDEGDSTNHKPNP